MAVFNASGSPVAVKLDGYLSLMEVSQNVDPIATLVQTATQFSESLPGGFRMDYSGSFSDYQRDSDSDTNLVAPRNAWLTGIETSLNGASVYVLSGLGFEARTVFQLSVHEQQAAIFAGNDQIVGSAHGDLLIGYGGDDTIDGGSGLDTVAYQSGVADYAVRAEGNGFAVTGPEGRDVLTNVERLRFSDKWMALDIEGNGGQAYRLYQAAFSRIPDEAGLGYWIQQIDGGMSLPDVANSFIISAEFQGLYGSSLTDRVFLERVYSNVLGRDYDQAGFDYWLDELERGVINRDGLLASFSESAENKANVIGQIANGFEYLI